MEEQLKNAISKLESIVNYHNKNLTKSQYFDLCEVLEIIKGVNLKWVMNYVIEYQSTKKMGQ